MRFVTDILKIILGVICGAALVGIFDLNIRFFGSSNAGSAQLDLSYADLAAVNLTAATVALGAVAVVVTVAAVFGYQVIRAASIAAAEDRVKGDLPTLLKRELLSMEKDGRLKNALERSIYSGGTDDSVDEPDK